MSQQVADVDTFLRDSKSMDTIKEAERKPAQKRQRDGSMKKKEVVQEIDRDHDLHILTERERRTKMKNMFSTLCSLIPNLPPKADKTTIVEAAISQIERLETTLKKLQEKKMDKIRGTAQQWRSSEPSREVLVAEQVKNLPLVASSECRFPLCFKTWSSPNVVISVSGIDAHINICALTKRGLLSNIVYSLEKHGLLVLTAHVSGDCFRSMYMIHAQANGTPDAFPMAISVEEIFISAVGEITTWIS